MNSLELKIVDSHTGGEPTRCVVDGGPNLGDGSMQQRLNILRTQHDYLRTALVNEPRGSDVMVGALLCDSNEANHAAGVIFFNNVGYLGMCGHGLIGVAVTLFHLGRIGLGIHQIETPVGTVTIDLLSKNRVTIKNVASYRYKKDIEVEVATIGRVIGDIAWGGNWFYLVKRPSSQLSLSRTRELIDETWKIREALEANGITGENNQIIDHIEFFAEPSKDSNADSRNFVLCPGKEYDRSPCGTGTSAKMACLYSDGLLKPDQVWRQQSIIGSVFEGTIDIVNGKVIPQITGEAFINMESKVIFESADPFLFGIGSQHD